MLDRRSENIPLTTESTLSPGLIVFAIAASIAPVPLQVSIKRSFFVLQSSFKWSMQETDMSKNSFSRWWIKGFDNAFKILSGTRVGPGVIKRGTSLLLISRWIYMREYLTFLIYN